jgi:hypothetical protein
VSGLQGQVGTLQGQLATANSQLAADASQLTTDNAAVNRLNTCLFEAPETLYGSRAGAFGYVFDLGNLTSRDVTALSVTYPGDPVSGWFLFDKCNTQTTAVARAANARAHGAIAPEGILKPFDRTF